MKFLKLISSLPTRLSSIYDQLRQHWQDTLIVIVLAVVAGVAYYQGAQLISPAIIDEHTFNVWFGADSPRVFGDMAIHNASHYRTSVHPLFVLLTFPFVYVLTKTLGIEPLMAVRLLIAIVSCFWISTLFILLRLITPRRVDATLFSILGSVSAAAIFWFVVPETYSFGSLSILLALCFVTLTQHQQFSWLWYVAVNALTFSFTVTNWMVGLLATLVNHRGKKFLQITLSAVCLLGVLALVQKVFFRSATLKNIVDQRSEMQYLFSPESGGPLQVVKSFVAHTLVMPAIEIVNSNDLERPNLLVMLTQNSLPGSASLWGGVAVVLWTALLSLGLWSLFSVKEHLKLRIVLGLTLVSQLILHVVYGSETFLYSLHFAPLLVVLAAFSTLTQARPLALVLASILIVSTGYNNGLQFNKAREHVNLYDGKRPSTSHQERSQMQQRPNEPWLHDTRQVVLAAPGSRQVDQTTSSARE